MFKHIKILILFFFVFSFSISPVAAHEQYVLTKQQLEKDMAITNVNVLSAFQSPENIKIGIGVGIGIAILIAAYFFFQYSNLGKFFDKKLYSLDNYGHFLLRIALAAMMIMSAYYRTFLGPEIPVTSIAFGNLLIPIMYTAGILLLLGIFNRIAAFVSFFILLLTTFIYKDYMITYLNYFGEIIALIIFGSYFWSSDNKLFGVSKFVKRYKEWEILLIRVTYGISIMYPAITLKILRPAVIIDIATRYRLNEINWLFPRDPLLISLGTGMAQILVGILIIIGFETRLASFLTFLLYIGSVLYFKEAVWPHFVLLALALYLVINNGGKITLDNYMQKLFFKENKSTKRHAKR